MGRNAVSDMEAVAAMPGLEELAEPIPRWMGWTRRTRSHPESLLVFAAGQWPCRSANELDSLFKHTGVWEQVRASAARVGRVLPEQPPTADQYHRMRRASVELAEELAGGVTGPAVSIARQVGLLAAGERSSAATPERAQTVYGDGSVFKALSDVEVAADGSVSGSRAKDPANARVAEKLSSKHGARSGLPITVVGCHGGLSRQRVILGLELYRDGSESDSAERLIRRVDEAAAGGVHAVVYDGLFSGRVLHRLMRRGIVPVAPMPSGDARRPGLDIPADLQRDRSHLREKRQPAKRRGKGRRRRSHSEPAAKSRVAVYDLGPLAHDTGGGCEHRLWAVDGALTVTDPAGHPSLDSPVAVRERLAFDGPAGARRLVGVYRLPCERGPLRAEVELSGLRKGANKHGEPMVLADWVRPIPEIDPTFDEVYGRRNDAESVFAWLKRQLPIEGRATSLSPEGFLVDLVGAALWCNAVAWDEHAAVHTSCARRGTDRPRRR